MNPETTSSIQPVRTITLPPGIGRTFRRPTPSEQEYQTRPAPERPRPSLTLREKEVLRLICDGRTNAEIGTQLNVSRETIKSELKRIFRKLGVANRTQAAVLLVRNDWI